MKNNRFKFLAVVLFILFSIGAGFIPPLIFLKWLTFCGIIFSEIRAFILGRKNNRQISVKTILGKGVFIVLLAVISVPITDIAKTKSNSAVCPYNKVHPSAYYEQMGIKNSFDFKNYIKELKEAASFLPIKADSIEYEKKYYEYLTIKYEPKNYDKKILIIASVHGDEPAGALSILDLLKDIKLNENKYKNTAIWILSPMNPVGLAFASRENGCGCNINRDYLNGSQIETKHIIKNIGDFMPDLILDLHENNGNWKTCLMANTLVPDSFGKRLSTSLSANNIELADNAFDANLEISGWHKRSPYRKIINKIAGLNDLMWYGQTLNLPVITLECDQSLEIGKRRSINMITIDAVIQNINYLKDK